MGGWVGGWVGWVWVGLDDLCEHPRVVKEMEAQFEQGQETQSPEVRSGWVGGWVGGFGWVGRMTHVFGQTF